jgi:hypothetical protein
LVRELAAPGIRECRSYKELGSAAKFYLAMHNIAPIEQKKDSWERGQDGGEEGKQASKQRETDYCGGNCGFGNYLKTKE